MAAAASASTGRVAHTPFIPPASGAGASALPSSTYEDHIALRTALLDRGGHIAYGELLDESIKTGNTVLTVALVCAYAAARKEELQFGGLPTWDISSFQPKEMFRAYSDLLSSKDPREEHHSIEHMRALRGIVLDADSKGCLPAKLAAMLYQEKTCLYLLRSSKPCDKKLFEELCASTFPPLKFSCGFAYIHHNIVDLSLKKVGETGPKHWVQKIGLRLMLESGMLKVIYVPSELFTPEDEARLWSDNSYKLLPIEKRAAKLSGNTLIIWSIDGLVLKRYLADEVPPEAIRP